MAFKIRSIFRAGKDKEAGDEDLQEQGVSHEQTQPQSDESESVLAAADVVSESPAADLKSDGKETAPDSETPAAEAVVAADGAQEDEGEDAGQAEPRQRQPKFVRPRNVDELLMQSLPERNKFASQNLKNLVNQTVLFDLMPSGRKYLFDPTIEGASTVTASKAVETACTIQIHEKDLMKIADGDLNPQVLMLSHKAKVWGNAQIATYIFNMIAPANNF